MEFAIATQVQIITIAIAVMAFFVVVASIVGGIVVYLHLKRQEDDLNALYLENKELWDQIDWLDDKN